MENLPNDNKLEMAEERVNEIEDRAIGIIHSKKRREKRLDNILWQYQAELTYM